MIHRTIIALFSVLFFHSFAFAQSPTNIIYIMLDDAGTGDIGATSPAPADSITPNIDSLFSGGMEFDNFYAGAPVCTPTRISVLTGTTPIAHGALHVFPFSSNPTESALNGTSNTVSLGLSMKQLGYKTAHFGKWHVGSSRPEYLHEAHGWDTWSFFRRSNLDDNHDNRAGITNFFTSEGDFTKDVRDVDGEFVDQIIDYINQNNDPFFINFWPLTPHTPIAVPRDYVNAHGFDLTTPRGQTLAMLNDFDDQVGRIIETLHDKGIFHETLIVFTSDNGALTTVQNPNEGLRGDKGQTWEGGIKVPFAAHWPNSIQAGLNNSFMTTADLLPTFVDLLGGDPNIEGIGESKAAALFGEYIESRKPFTWGRTGTTGASADFENDDWHSVRIQNWKWTDRKGRIDGELHYLPDNPSEIGNLENAEPEIFDIMERASVTERFKFSRYEDFPESPFGKTVIDFDPRLDVVSKSLTLHFKMEVGDLLADTLYRQEESHTLSVRADGALEWVVEGGDTLVSPPLSQGVHEVTIRVKGYNRRASLISLLIDGTVVDETATIDSFNSVNSDIEFGSDYYAISDARYHLEYFNEDELALIYETTPDYVLGTPSDDRLDGTSLNETFLTSNGNDHVFGRGGTDTFIVTAPLTRVRDYELGELIDVSSWGVTSISDFDIARTLRNGHSTFVLGEQRLIVHDTDYLSVNFRFLE